MTSNDIIHLTSQRAASQKRNIFIWCGCSDTVSISFRGDLNVTERRIYTWVDIIIKEDLTGILSSESLQYSIFPVTVEPSRGEILCYQAFPKTPLNPLSRVSDSAVEPGDYGIYATDGTKPPYFYEFTPMISLAEKNSEIAEAYPELIEICHNPSQEIMSQVLKQDDDKCLITGVDLRNRTDVQAVWVLPLWGEYLTVIPDLRQNYDERIQVKRKVFKDLEFYKRMEMARNCLVTVKEVAELFWNNQIAIDVDNDYEIVCFDKPSLDLSSPLLEQLIQVKAREALDDTFLRAHFRYSLLVNIVGGGVFDDFTSKEVNTFIDRHMEEIQSQAFQRGIWQEGIGKLVGQWVMNESLVKRLAEI